MPVDWIALHTNFICMEIPDKMSFRRMVCANVIQKNNKSKHNIKKKENVFFFIIHLEKWEAKKKPYMQTCEWRKYNNSWSWFHLYSTCHESLRSLAACCDENRSNRMLILFSSILSWVLTKLNVNQIMAKNMIRGLK